MSAKVTNAVNLDDFDEETPYPLELKFSVVEIKDLSMLNAVLDARAKDEKRRGIRKLLLATMATVITMALIFT